MRNRWARLLHFQFAQATPYDNADSGLVAENVKEAIDELSDKANVAVYTIPLIYNGSISGDTFISYSNLTPNTPIIIPVKGEFIAFSYSNTRSSADYTFEFRRNTTVGTPFFSVSKTNTQYFSQAVTPEPFEAGDIISLKYIDDGGNSTDGVWILGFRALP